MSDIKKQSPDIIRNWSYLENYEVSRKEIMKVVDRVFSSGRLILGDEVAQFEKAFSTYCETDYGVGVNSGTDALILALKALGIKGGDEVITVSYTAVPTVAAIRATGATPVFIDVEEDTFLMDVTKLEAVVSAKTRCLVPVHLFGQPVDMSPLLEIAAAHGLSVVEDCAQAAGALYHGGKVGGLGDIGAFSFYPTKILGAYGDGGMVITRNGDLHRKLRRLRFYGMDEAYHSEEEGCNSRLDEVQAAILNYKLKTLDKLVAHRRRLAIRYSKGLREIGDISLPSVNKDRSHQFYTYTIRTSLRDRLMEYLATHGIAARINYQPPVHLMRGYRFLGYKKGDLPVTERLSEQSLSLPLYPELSPAMVDRVTETIRTFYTQT